MRYLQQNLMHPKLHLTTKGKNVEILSLLTQTACIKWMGVFVRNSERNPERYLKILFCGHGLKFFAPQEGHQ